MAKVVITLTDEDDSVGVEMDFTPLIGDGETDSFAQKLAMWFSQRIAQQDFSSRKETDNG